MDFIWSVDLDRSFIKACVTKIVRSFFCGLQYEKIVANYTNNTLNTHTPRVGTKILRCLNLAKVLSRFSVLGDDVDFL